MGLRSYIRIRRPLRKPYYARCCNCRKASEDVGCYSRAEFIKAIRKQGWKIKPKEGLVLCPACAESNNSTSAALSNQK